MHFMILAISITLISSLILWFAVKRQIKRRRRLREEELFAQQSYIRSTHSANDEYSFDESLLNFEDFSNSKGIEVDNMITVTEIAKIKAKPDTVLASITIRNREKDYRTCQAELDKRTKNLTGKLRGLSLPELFIATSNFQIFPDYDNERKLFNKRFNGNHEFTVKFAFDGRSLESFYSALFEIEDNAELDLSFRLSDIDSAKRNAIETAIHRATSTAMAVAQSAQITLGKVSSIKPQVVVGKPQHHRLGGPEQYYMREAVLRVSDGGESAYAIPSIEAGELEVVASVTMRFRIESI